MHQVVWEGWVKEKRESFSSAISTFLYACIKQNIPQKTYPHYKTETFFILTAIRVHYVFCLPLQLSIPHILHSIAPCISSLSSVLLFQNSSLKLISFLT